MFSDEFLEKVLANKLMRLMPICYQSASIKAFEIILAEVMEDDDNATISELYVSKPEYDAVSTTISADE